MLSSLRWIGPSLIPALLLRNNFTPRGDVPAHTKVLSLHTDKDGLVVVEQEHSYQSVMPAANLATAIAVEAAPSHCGFTQAELVSGWESLRGWVATGVKPGVPQIQGLCSALAAGGMASGPCRFNPAYVINDLDTRILPRW